MESSRRLIMLLIAGVIVAFAAIAVRSYMSEEPQTAAPQVAVRILVAKRDISPGSVLQLPQDMDWETVSEEAAAKEGMMREGQAQIGDINGAIARRMMHAGEPIDQSMITKPGSGGLMSSVLEPGMRAVAISVTATSGNAGFVLPGDYVDLILTREINRTVSNGQAQETRKNIYSKTFVTNVRVLAADQMLDNPDNKAVIAKTVSVEVTPQQAQMIAVATELGKISVSLRSAQNSGPVAGKADGIKDMLSDGASDVDMRLEPNTADQGEMVKILRPGEVQNLEFNKRAGKGGPEEEIPDSIALSPVANDNDTAKNISNATSDPAMDLEKELRVQP